MVQDDLVWFWQVPGHFMMLELADRLVKDVRAYAYATKESWIIAMGQEKRDLLLYRIVVSAAAL